MNNNTTIKGVEYAGFSVDRAEYGGYNKKDTIATLKAHGIKVNTTHAYTPYVGHWAMLVEAKYEKEVSDWLWSQGELKDHKKEK